MIYVTQEFPSATSRSRASQKVIYLEIKIYAVRSLSNPLLFIRM